MSVITIRVGHRKGTWHVITPFREFTLMKSDEKIVEHIRQQELLKGKSCHIITKKALAEQFGGAVLKALKNPGDEVTFEDCGFFERREKELKK